MMTQPAEIDIGLMTTAERQAELFKIQKRLQALWDRIEWHWVTYGDSPSEKGKHALDSLWGQFERWEIEERRYLRPGFPLTRKKKR